MTDDHQNRSSVFLMTTHKFSVTVSYSKSSSKILSTSLLVSTLVFAEEMKSDSTVSVSLIPEVISSSSIFNACTN